MEIGWLRWFALRRSSVISTTSGNILISDAVSGRNCELKAYGSAFKRRLP